MSQSHSKVAIVGAGAVGSAMAYACLIRESAREVVLYDIDSAKVTAEVLDLAHGTQFTGSSKITGGNSIELMADADVVVITAGAKQKPGQTRLDLAATNVRILESMLPGLVAVAPSAVYVLVTNPCDVLAVVAQQITGLPSTQVFASGTVLDSARLRWLLAERLQVASPSVHAYIVGEHGDSEFPLWSQTRIGPVPLSEWRLPEGGFFTEGELISIAEQVKNAAYQVIAGKGATNYAIGLSGARIVEAIINDENAVLPVSSLLSGYRGISGVALSVPSVVGAAGISRVIDVPMSGVEQARLDSSAVAIADSLRSLGI